MIRFEYEGVWYEVDPEAFEAGKIILPDGRLYEVETWTRSEPPIPLDLILIQHRYLYSDLRKLANRFDAVIATLAEE